MHKKLLSLSECLSNINKLKIFVKQWHVRTSRLVLGIPSLFLRWSIIRVGKNLYYVNTCWTSKTWVWQIQTTDLVTGFTLITCATWLYYFFLKRKKGFSSKFHINNETCNVHHFYLCLLHIKTFKNEQVFFYLFFFFVTTCWTFSIKKIRKTTSKKGALVNKKSQYINLTTLWMFS